MWVEVQIQNLRLDFFKEKKSNDFFCWISKSKFALNGYTNRLFFKRFVVGGFYRLNIENEEINIQLYCLLKDSMNVNSFRLNMLMRCAKKGIKVKVIHLIDEEILPMKYPNYFRKFGLIWEKR